MSVQTSDRPPLTQAPSPPLLATGRGWRDEASAALNGIYTMWYRDVLRFSRDRGRIAASLAQPTIFLFIFGTGLSPAMGRLGGGQSGVSYTQFMFPGIITMAVLFTAVFSAISIVWDREFGFLKEVLVAPVPRWSVAVGKALGSTTAAMVQGMLILLFAPLVGVGLTALSILELLLVMFLTAFALSSLGLVIAARMKSMEGFQVVMNFVMMPLFFLSGALFPLDSLPPWLSVLTRIDPVSYGVDAIRHIVLSQAAASPDVIDQLGMSLFGRSLNPLVDVAFIILFAALMISLAVRAFSAQE